jgi:hypothetical protein
MKIINEVVQVNICLRAAPFTHIVTAQTIVRERRTSADLSQRQDLLSLFMKDIPLSGASFVCLFFTI